MANKLYKFFALTLIVFSLSAVLFFTRLNDVSWNDRSRLATIQSLTQKRSLIIDNTLFETGDKVFVPLENILSSDKRSKCVNNESLSVKSPQCSQGEIAGHFYSDKPPLFSVLAAIPCFIVHPFGIDFVTRKGVLIYIVTLFSESLPMYLFFYFFYRVLNEKGYFFKEKNLFLISLFIVGTCLISFSTVLNNHLPAGLLCGAAVLLFWKGSYFNDRSMFVSGFLLSLATVIDPGALFFLTVFGAWLCFKVLFAKEDKTQKTVFVSLFILGTAIPLFFHFLLNFPITGDLFPASMHPELFDYKNSPFASSNLTGASAAINGLGGWWNYFWSMLFGKRGFFLHNPILLLGLLCGFYLCVKAKKEKTFYAALLLSVFSVIGYYSLFGKNYGGPAYLTRWLVLIIPPLFILVVEFVKHCRELFDLLVFLVLVSAVWNMSAMAGVYDNFEKYDQYHGVTAVKQLPKKIKAQKEEWKSVLGK